MSKEPLRIFKPRSKETPCEHWIDCYKNAKWCIELDHYGDTIFQFFCESHKNRFVREYNKGANHEQREN